MLIESLKVKISFMTHVCKDWSLDEVIAAAVRYGYHGIEFRCDTATSTAWRRRQRPRNAARFGARWRRRGWRVAALQRAYFVCGRGPADGAALIQLAADIGAPGLRVFTCWPMPEGMTTAQAIEQCGSIWRCSGDGAEGGVELWLETHDLMCKAADAVAAVRRANHPAVKLNYDMLHPYRMASRWI